MAEAGGASTWAAPRQLLQAAPCIVRRMGEAGGASTRAVPRQSLELQAARSARCVCGAHSRSPTVRRRSNPQGTTWHSAAAAGGGLRINQLTAEARPGLLIGCTRYHGYLAQSVGTHAGRGTRAKAMAPTCTCNRLCTHGAGALLEAAEALRWRACLGLRRLCALRATGRPYRGAHLVLVVIRQLHHLHRLGHHRASTFGRR
jgi:hypothetical protein